MSITNEVIGKLRLTAKDEWFLNKVEPELLIRAANEIDRLEQVAMELHKAGCEESERLSELRQYLKRQQSDTARSIQETASNNVHMIRYLQGMNDAFCRVVLFLAKQV